MLMVLLFHLTKTYYLNNKSITSCPRAALCKLISKLRKNKDITKAIRSKTTLSESILRHFQIWKPKRPDITLSCKT